METAHEALKRLFGYDEFRPSQEAVVGAILSGRDCFVVMPTGGGKSLCYQLPAHLLPGTCLVISPLIALMKDQVDVACANGLRAAFYNSTLSDSGRTEVLSRFRSGALDLLYVSPERFAMESFQAQVVKANVCLVAVDEAHCVSEWGHDFRPDYLHLSNCVKLLPHVPVAAFTATATQRVQQDIVKRLGLRKPFEVRASFDRPNLYYEVIARSDTEHQIASYVMAREGQSGIVYRMTRQAVEDTAKMLSRKGVHALPYHAGMDDDERARNQETFIHDDTAVIVATIAFGMGIDKPNVRYVLHGDLSRNVEAYYQESGRAGRDGEPAYCTLLFSRGDIPRIRYFIEQVENDTERKRLNTALRDMVTYAGGGAQCRRSRLLGYFGETYGSESCSACDVCAGQKGATVDATREAQMVLSAIARTGERFGAAHISDIVRGSKRARILELGHDKLPTYGVGREHERPYWRALIDELVSRRVVVESEGEFAGLVLTPLAREVLKGVCRFETRAQNTAEKTPVAPRDRTWSEPSSGSLFERLRALRSRLARERGLPAYMVFSDRSLRDMAARRPLNARQMAQVHGVGEVKLATYGEQFIAEIRRSG